MFDPIRQLLKLSSCDIADALHSLGVENCGHLDGINMYSPSLNRCSKSIVGRAYTVRFDHKSKVNTKSESHYIDSIPKNSILMISQPKDSNCAVFGGIMGTRARQEKVAGVVVDGRIRDINQHRSNDLLVFARGTSVISSRAQLNVAAVEEPITISNVLVTPGDYVIADADGIVSVPSRMIKAVITEATRIADEDVKICDAVKKGSTVTNALKLHRS